MFQTTSRMAGIVLRTNALDVKKCISLFLFGLLAYFVLGDIYLYLLVQDSSGLLPLSFSDNSSMANQFSPYRTIGVKSLLLDLPDFYIYLPVSRILYELGHFDTILRFITPNAVSYFHVLVALISANCVNNDSINIRRIGVGLFALRNFLDAMDGTIARSRNLVAGGVESIGTFGYYLDGVADGLGCIFLYVSCLLYLHRHPVRSRNSHAYSPLPLVVINRSGGDNGEPAAACWKDTDVLVASGKTIQGWSPLPFIFGIQTLICSYSWNRYIVLYMQLLEDSASATPNTRAFQGRVVKSTMMWVVVMFWRLFNAHSMVDMLLFAIFFDKMGEFLSFMQFLGFLPLVSAISLTEIHLNDIQLYLPNNVH